MFLGIEIGGSKLQLGVGPGDGTIVALERAHVDPAAGAEGIRRQILESLPIVLRSAGTAKHDIRAVGIGFGGPVDANRGIVTKSHQIEGWAGFPLADWSLRELGWPTVVHNDADTAGLAEACFGAGRGYSPIFYITIGSGIGGGLIIDQKIYRGAGAGAGEIGHLRLPDIYEFSRPLADRENDTPVLPYIVEERCSGWAMAHALQRVVSRFAVVQDRDAKQLIEMVGGRLENLNCEIIAQAARLGNALAKENLSVTCRILGWAIAQVITLLCPRRVLIGGGVSLIGEDLLFAPLRDEVARFVFPPFADSFEIVQAKLKEAVVVHGALRLAKDSTGSDS